MRFNINIIGVGIDIENISKFSESDCVQDSRFLNSIFTKKEQDYCFSNLYPTSHLTARFCAKEAVIKAMSCIQVGDLDYRDIEVVNHENGVPYIIINKRGFEDTRVLISLSHCKEMAIAIALLVLNR